MCGENLCSRSLLLLLLGSPPRVRGKRIEIDGNNNVHRITPACAGKTFCLRLSRPYYRDHPRVCGENAGVLHYGINKKGSPPRVRGKQKYCTAIEESFRITPACAGKTVLDELIDNAEWDHPRVCGENVLAEIPS